MLLPWLETQFLNSDSCTLYMHECIVYIHCCVDVDGPVKLASSLGSLISFFPPAFQKNIAELGIGPENEATLKKYCSPIIASGMPVTFYPLWHENKISC